MVSFHTPPSPNGTKTTPGDILNNSSKKRRWEESETDQGIILDKRSKPDTTKSIFEIELHLESPLPSEWQRCLDIQSGQIHFYNTRTHKRTSKDPRRSPEPQSPDHMSLDLELNLPCESKRKDDHANSNHVTEHSSGSSMRFLGDLLMDSRRESKISGGLTRSQSWLTYERDTKEMVATVCTKCHMLVMLCKSCPACPNCKFMHSPDQSSPKLFKQSLSLLC